MNIEFEEVVEHDDGSATFTLTGSKEDMEAFRTAMFNNFLVNAIKSLKEEEMITLDDMQAHVIKINYDDFDKIQNKLIQAEGIINVALEAYSGSEFRDLNSSLWAVSDMLRETLKLLDGESL
jgi:cytoplasmic iron level regulating protein YaaA (DUF328/UPF0246 family)